MKSQDFPTTRPCRNLEPIFEHTHRFPTCVFVKNGKSVLDSHEGTRQVVKTVAVHRLVLLSLYDVAGLRGVPKKLVLNSCRRD